jgi:hypothetical protein
LLDRHTLGQPGKGPQERARVLRTRETHIQPRRQQHVDVAELRHLETLGQDADDPHRIVVHDESFAQSLRVASK